MPTDGAGKELDTKTLVILRDFPISPKKDSVRKFGLVSYNGPPQKKGQRISPRRCSVLG